MYVAVASVFTTEGAGPDIGLVFASTLGTLFIGAAFIAVGIFSSSVTENQIVAAVISFSMLLFFLMIGYAADFVGNYKALQFLQYLSVSGHMTYFLRGVISVQDTLYYVSFIGFMMFLTYLVIRIPTVEDVMQKRSLTITLIVIFGLLLTIDGIVAWLAKAPAMDFGWGLPVYLTLPLFALGIILSAAAIVMMESGKLTEKTGAYLAWVGVGLLVPSVVITGWALPWSLGTAALVAGASDAPRCLLAHVLDGRRHRGGGSGGAAGVPGRGGLDHQPAGQHRQHHHLPDPAHR